MDSERFASPINGPFFFFFFFGFLVGETFITKMDPWFANADNRQDLQLLDGLWWKGDLIAVPHVASLRSALIWDYHDSPYAGHLGVNKTLHNVQRTFWWPGMFSDINEHVRTCVSRRHDLST